MKILSVGDIHTKQWIIDKVESVIDQYDKVVFVGDYADNWGATANDSINTWKRLYKFQQDYENKVSAVLGNHDHVYLKCVHRYQSGFNDDTKMLMGLPENKELERWLSELPYVVEIDNITYSHAGLTNFWRGKYGLEHFDRDSLWENDSPIWARPAEFQSHYYGNQVFGHTPQKTCTKIQSDNVWCIDTHSTYHTGENIGDNSFLEVIDGKEFNVIKL